MFPPLNQQILYTVYLFGLFTHGSCNVVENEIHFLCKCNKYDTFRLKMLDNISATNISPLDHERTFIKLMTSSDINIIKAIANFVK